MKYRIFYILSLAILFNGAVLAHHAAAPHFDSSKPVTIEGVVSDFKLVNPHAYLYIDVTDENGETVTWNCEMLAASTMRRTGWTQDTFKVGAQIVVQGSAARRDPNGCSYNSGVLADGTEISRFGPIKARSGDVEGTAVAAIAKQNIITGERSVFGNWKSPEFGHSAGGVIATAPILTGNFIPGEGSEENPLGRYAEYLTEIGTEDSLKYDERFDDPALLCSPSSIIRAWAAASSTNEIIQTDDQIFIKHEFMDTVRVVYMDGRDHPQEGEFGFTGHSVGHFEGDDLVINTTNFEAGVLIPHPGVLHSNQMVIDERISVSEDGSVLTHKYSVMDPLFLTKPITGTNVWDRTDLPLAEYNCVELGDANHQSTE